jgi:hypothetical protein
MPRVNYIDYPNAPAANSIVPSVVAAVVNDAGEPLLIHCTDKGIWAPPGGGHDIDVEVIGLIGLYTNPRHVMATQWLVGWVAVPGVSAAS